MSLGAGVELGMGCKRGPRRARRRDLTLPWAETVRGSVARGTRDSAIAPMARSWIVWDLRTWGRAPLLVLAHANREDRVLLANCLVLLAACGVDQPWTAKEAEHLLNRAAFGASAIEVRAAVERGRAATIEQLFAPSPPQDMDGA